MMKRGFNVRLLTLAVAFLVLLLMDGTEGCGFGAVSVTAFLQFGGKPYLLVAMHRTF